MKRLRLTGVAAVLGLAAALGLAIAGAPAAIAATAAPAHAAAPAATAACPSGKVCVYADANYFDGPATFRTTNANWGIFGSSGACKAGSTAAKDDTNGSWNDCMSSVRNRTADTMTFFVNAGCLGTWFNLRAGQEYPNMSEITSYNFNDKISSDFVAGSC
jgi:hypothetical protein